MNVHHVFSDKANPSPLPFFSPPQKGESFFGYFLRLQELNCYPEIGWIPNVLSGKQFKISARFMHENASLIAVGLGLEEDVFSDVFDFPKSGRGHRRRADCGFHLNAKFKELGSKKICSQCLAEFGYVQKIWELRPLLACPRHAVYLLSECHECGTNLSAQRLKLCFCHACGRDLRRATTEKASHLALQMAKLIASKSVVPYLVSNHNIPMPWRDEAMSTIIHNYYLLYKYHLQRKSSVNGSNIDWYEALRLCASIFLDWPNSYVSYLQVHMSFESNSSVSAGPKSVLNSVRPFYSAITTTDRTGMYQHLKKVMSHYILKNKNIYSVTRRGGCAVYDNTFTPIYMTQEEVRKELNICSDKFLKLFGKRVLNGVRLRIGQQHVFRIYRKSVEQYLRSQGNTWSLQKFEMELGITSTVRRNLLSVGLFPQERQGNGVFRVDVSALSYFKRLVSKEASPIYFPLGELFTFSEACRFAAKLHGYTMKKFIQAVLSGLVRPRLVIAKRQFLNGLYYAEWDIRKLANQECICASNVLSAFKIAPGSDVAKNISKKLGIRERSPDQRRLFSLEQVIRFSEKYIPINFLKQSALLNSNVEGIVQCSSLQNFTLPVDAVHRFLLGKPVLQHSEKRASHE